MDETNTCELGILLKRTKTGSGAGGRGRNYEGQYEAKKTGKSAPVVKKVVKKVGKKVGNARKRVERTGSLKWEGRAGVEARHQPC